MSIHSALVRLFISLAIRMSMILAYLGLQTLDCADYLLVLRLPPSLASYVRSEANQRLSTSLAGSTIQLSRSILCSRHLVQVAPGLG